MKPFFCLLLSVCGFLVSSCSQPASYATLSGPTMGTTFNISIESSGVDLKQLQTALEQELADINQLMSTYIPDSEINRFNKLTGASCFIFSDKTWAVLTAAKEVNQQTDGAFDITMGPLISRWGFNAEEYATKVPSPAELQKIKSYTGSEKLEYNFSEQCIRKTQAKVTINLSAIAKGYAVDQLALILKKFNIHNFLIDIGGEVKAKGVNSSQRAWTIAVESPSAQAQQGSTIIQLENTSIATSGDYRNYFEVAGQRFSHTIDPQTGYPISHSLTSVSVIHPSNMYADAYATAISVMGASKGLEFANKTDLAVYTIQRLNKGLITNSNPEFDKYSRH